MISTNEIYRLEKLKRKDFLSRESVTAARLEADDLLTILVPKFVLDRILNMEMQIAE